MRRLIGIQPFAWLLVVAEVRAEVPTFNKDIAPILWTNCAGCHRPGEIGPFSLLTYRDAAKRASFLAEITSSRRMPPWKPEPGFGSFHDERRLSDAEIRTIADRVEADAPEGNPIPERFRDALGRFDRNQDGKLSRAEIDGMPETLRGQVQEAIGRRLGSDEVKP